MFQVSQLLKFLAYGRKEYYRDKYNWIDDAHFIMFVIYFFKRLYFLEDILPCDYLHREHDRMASEGDKSSAINSAKMEGLGIDRSHIA